MAYPYCVELPLSRGFISIIGWLEVNGITDYSHESVMVGEKPHIQYRFSCEKSAVIFALKWA